MDVIDRDLGKTPSVHDCTQITIVNNKSTLSTSTMEILKLELVVLDSVKLTIGSQYEIFPYGLRGSERGVKDGCVYAGSLEKSNEKRVNDIILPSNEKGVGDRHFMIKFHKGKGKIDKCSYMIRDMGEGMGTFIRLDRPLELHSNFIVSFGESHVIVQIEENLLMLRFIDGPRNEEKYSFTPSDSPVKLGRMADCDIRFDDTSLSRYHCLLNYTNYWMLVDGDGEKLSTNGTWLFAESFFDVFDGMVFKVGETLFKAQLTNELANISKH